LGRQLDAGAFAAECDKGRIVSFAKPGFQRSDESFARRQRERRLEAER